MRILGAKYTGSQYTGYTASIMVQLSEGVAKVEYGTIAPPLGGGRMNDPVTANPDLAIQEILTQTKAPETEIRAAISDYLNARQRGRIKPPS
ncbi:hypothetical protein [Falsochrobactrum ovis]|uniref:Uncharacterized protein n=1 Tax=Falsochrobactrum ovis TaxID=1293442 RepID=A0A364JTC0_9HYPH|nr:hypothetical protein C7374_11487 [Falsochrobactrum ovis]